MKLVASSLCICIVTCSVAVAQLNTACFQNGGSVLVTPQDSAYSNDRLIFNQKVRNQPAAVAYAYTEAQVQNIVRCAQASGLKAVPRGGGHGYEGYAIQNGTITLDITNLTSFTVSNDKASITFGPGLRLGQLYLRMYLEADSLFPAGTCPWVGTSGHILGGGTGLNVRSYGLACDNLVSLNMVDYKGDVIFASQSQNADLFWASCGGGGGNLGIVTSFTVKTNPLTDLQKVTTIQLAWGYDQAVQVFDAVQRWVPTADRRLNAQILIGFGSTNLGLQWEGPQAEAEQAIQSSGLLSIPGLLSNRTAEGSWINATLLWASNAQGLAGTSIYDLNMTDGLPPGQARSFQAASSYNQQLMSIEGIQTMVNAVTSQSSSGTAYIEHKMLGGKIGDVAPTDTAFYFRNSLYETQYLFYWTSGDLQGTATQWLSSTVAAMKPYVGQGAYINYPDPLLAATSTWPQAYYGGNLDQYVAIKTKYDPSNYFSNPLTVRPTANTSASVPATSSSGVQAAPPARPSRRFAQPPSTGSPVVSPSPTGKSPTRVARSPANAVENPSSLIPTNLLIPAGISPAIAPGSERLPAVSISG